MHRLSCFRDDVIFLIFLYQKWIYPTDYTRVNEYGFKRKDNASIQNNNTANNTQQRILNDDLNDDLDDDLDNEVDPKTKKTN